MKVREKRANDIKMPRDDVWEREFGEIKTEGICPCCKKNEIHKRMSAGPFGWQNGHLIHDHILLQRAIEENRERGPEQLINFRPLCLFCNGPDTWLPSNYHYSAYLEVITEEEADRLCSDLIARMEVIERTPRTKCIGYCKTKNKKTGEVSKCPRNTIPGKLLCKKCAERNEKEQNEERAANTTRVGTMLVYADEIRKSTCSLSDTDRERLVDLQRRIGEILCPSKTFVHLQNPPPPAVFGPNDNNAPVAGEPQEAISECPPLPPSPEVERDSSGFLYDPELYERMKNMK